MTITCVIERDGMHSDGILDDSLLNDVIKKSKFLVTINSVFLFLAGKCVFEKNYRSNA